MDEAKRNERRIGQALLTLRRDRQASILITRDTSGNTMVSVYGEGLTRGRGENLRDALEDAVTNLGKKP